MSEAEIPAEKYELMVELAKAVMDGSTTLQFYVKQNANAYNIDYSVLGYRVMHEALRRIMQSGSGIDLTNIPTRGNA